MCMYVNVYACMCACLCVCACICLYMYICVRIFQLLQFQVAYRMKNGMCVYDCVSRVRVCVCVANGCTYMFDSLGSEGVKIRLNAI